MDAEASRYSNIGVQENMQHTVDVLYKSGVLSKYVYEYSRSREMAAINVSEKQKELLSSEICYNFYRAFPYDFALLSNAYYASRKEIGQ